MATKPRKKAFVAAIRYLRATGMRDRKGRWIAHAAYRRMHFREMREAQELTDRRYNMKCRDRNIKVSGTLRLGRDGFVWLDLFDRKGRVAVMCHRLPVKKVRWRFSLYPIYRENEKDWRIWNMREMVG